MPRLAPLFMVALVVAIGLWLSQGLTHKLRFPSPSKRSRIVLEQQYPDLDVYLISGWSKTLLVHHREDPVLDFATVYWTPDESVAAILLHSTWGQTSLACDVRSGHVLPSDTLSPKIAAQITAEYHLAPGSDPLRWAADLNSGARFRFSSTHRWK